MTWFGSSKGPQEGSNIKGQYRLTHQLAETRFSEVYKGVQRSTGQPVAIKLLRLDDFPKEERELMRTRFLREAGACARLRHPNVVRLLDSGTLGSKTLYLVFDFVEGTTLAELLSREGTLPPFDVRRLMSQCIDALAAGHEQGVVHRDFKPGNVMVSATGAQRNAIVLDFGLAGATSMWESMIGVRATEPGQVPGTAAYLAPEQIEGEICAQSDIYAWGLVTIECLSGERVVQGATDFEMVMQHMQGGIEVPSALMRHPLGAILARAIATSLDERYPDAAAVLDDLRRCPFSDLPAIARTASEDLPVLPSCLLTDLARDPKALLMPPTMPIAVLRRNTHAKPGTNSRAIEVHSDLGTLFEAYHQICSSYGMEQRFPHGTFVEIMTETAEHLRAQLACDEVGFSIEVEDGEVRLRPAPTWTRSRPLGRPPIPDDDVPSVEAWVRLVD